MTQDHWLNEAERHLYHTTLETTQRPVMLREQGPDGPLDSASLRSVEYALQMGRERAGMRPVLPHGPESGWAEWVSAEIEWPPREGPALRKATELWATVWRDRDPEQRVRIALPVLAAGTQEENLEIWHTGLKANNRDGVRAVLYAAMAPREQAHWADDDSGIVIARERTHERMDHLALAICGQQELAFQRRLAMMLDELGDQLPWPRRDVQAERRDGLIRAWVTGRANPEE